MQAEIEVKFTDIDIGDMREKLMQNGAHLEQPMRLMRRALIEQPEHKAQHAFIRIRDEGNRVTLTFKRHIEFDEPTVNSLHEIEVLVSDFDKTVALLKEAGWMYTTFQESKRETWTYKECEIVIDEWPWLKPYVEIEGPTEKDVKEVAGELGFDWKAAQFGHVDMVYAKEYDFAPGFRGVIDLLEVRFQDPLPKQFKPRKL